MTLKKLIFKNAALLAAAWALIIFILCATPGQYIPSASWLELLSFDKWVHAGMFFVLVSLLLIALAGKRSAKPVVLAGIAACVLYGGLLEVMQAKCFSNRSADWQDFVANTAGCLLALALSKKILILLSPHGPETR